MSEKKSEYLNLRITPSFKEALQKAADIEHRSISNMVEILIRDHCRNTGIKIEDVPTKPAQKSFRKKGTTSGE